MQFFPRVIQESTFFLETPAAFFRKKSEAHAAVEDSTQGVRSQRDALAREVAPELDEKVLPTLSSDSFRSTKPFSGPDLEAIVPGLILVAILMRIWDC